MLNNTRGNVNEDFLQKIILLLFVSMLLSILNCFNYASALSVNVEITTVFQKDVNTRLSSLYKKMHIH